MRKLTRREKYLIYAALLLSIVTGGYYFLEQPSELREERAVAELQMLEMEKKLKDGALENEPEVRAAYETVKEYYRRHREDFDQVLSNAALEQVILDYLKRYGIDAYRTEINDPSIQSDLGN